MAAPRPYKTHIGNHALHPETPISYSELRLLTDIQGKLEPTSAHSAYVLNEGFQSSFTVPMVYQDDFLGFMFFDSRKNDTFTPSTDDQITLTGGGPAGIVLDEATGKWGIRVNRVELKAIEPPSARTKFPTALSLLALKVSCLGRAFPMAGKLQTFATLTERTAAMVIPSAVTSKPKYWLESFVILAEEMESEEECHTS